MNNKDYRDFEFPIRLTELGEIELAEPAEAYIVITVLGNQIIHGELRQVEDTSVVYDGEEEHELLPFEERDDTNVRDLCDIFNNPTFGGEDNGW